MEGRLKSTRGYLLHLRLESTGVVHAYGSVCCEIAEPQSLLANSNVKRQQRLRAKFRLEQILENRGSRERAQVLSETIGAAWPGPTQLR